MSNNQKYIVLPGGETCKPVNPYLKPTHDEKYPDVLNNPKWHEFELNAPTFPITEVMPEGEEFEGSDVWRYWHPIAERFNDAHQNEYQQYGTYAEFKRRHEDNGIKTELAIKPLNAIEPVSEEYDVIMKTYEAVDDFCHDDFRNEVLDVVENKEETVTLAQAAIEHLHGSCMSTNGRIIFLNGAEFGANWQQSQSIEGIVGLNEYVDKLEGLLLNLRHHAGLSDSNIEWIDRVINENPTS